MSDPGNASVNHPLPLAGVPGWDATVDALIVGYGAAGACAALGRGLQFGNVDRRCHVLRAHGRAVGSEGT